MLSRSLMLTGGLLAVLFVSSAEAQLRSPLITELEAQKRGLTRAWYTQVPLDRTRDRIENITLHDGTLFVQSKRGTITALDGETGQRLWVTNVGRPEHPTTAVGASDLYVAALNGSTLYVLFRNNGKVFWQRKTKGAPGAGPALTKDHVFIPMINGLVEAYKLNDSRKPPWIYNSSGRAVVQPLVTEFSVGWPTDRGLFYVGGTDRLGVRFRVEAVEPIVCQPGYAYPHFYVGSLDGYLYKVHERSGAMLWRYSTGRPISLQPLPVGDSVYVTAERSGLYCVDAETADEKWSTPRIKKVLAVSPKRVYAVDVTGRINIMRADTGAVLSRSGVNNLDILVTNTENDRLYVASEFGLVQCLREVELVEPVIHSGPGKPIEDERVVTKQQGLDEALAQPPEDKQPAKPPGGNPFGDGGGEDPFGGVGNDPFGGGDPPAGGGDPPAGGSDPFGGGDDPPAGGGDDPFGGGGGGDDPPAGGDPFGGDDDPFG